MGFINKTVHGVLKLGRRAKHMVGKMAPYARAALNTVVNNPELLPQLAGIAAGAVGLGGELAAGPVTMGGSAVAAAGTGAALLAAGKKTFGDISKAYKSELKTAKGKKKVAFTQDDVAKLREAKAQIGKAKQIYKDSRDVNINE